MNKSVPVLGICVLFLIGGCKNGNEQAFTGSGTFEATKVLVSSQSAGELKGVFFEEGDLVAKDKTLAETDVENLRLQRNVTAASLDELEWNTKTSDREIAAATEQVTQASATLDNTRRTRDRLASLFEQGAATRETLDKAETELTVAASRLKAAENQLAGFKAKKETIKAGMERVNASLKLLDYQIEKGTVVTPLDGVIIEKYVEQGELANPGTPICSIADLSSMWLTIYVSEPMLGLIKIGSKAKLRIDSHPDRTFDGTVTWISEEAEFTPKNVQTKESRVELVYAVKITVDNSAGIFKIGMPADAYIEGL
ncbi:efflux RND transporter periplasmic adaptor subunit [bacterium]|nr:efflux RND transporter periplasmic adaptor subunit [bacterium]